MIQQRGQASARPYNALVGHAVGLCSAILLVVALGLSATPSVFEAHTVSGARVAAAVLALALASLLELLLRAQHPPGAATTLLVALGSFHPNWHDAAVVLGGVLAVTAAGTLLQLVPHAPAQAKS